VYLCPWKRFCYCIWVYLTVGLTWFCWTAYVAPTRVTAFCIARVIAFCIARKTL